jgi:hypothetical protein
VKWESGREHSKADYSLKSFLFTLKNPHNIPARRFALKAEKKRQAICCISEYGPIFPGGADILVYDNCDANENSYSFFGYTYTNDTGLNGDVGFTGVPNFRVKEIEVFEITT